MSAVDVGAPVLDNPGWAAMTGPLAHLSTVHGRAARLPEDVAPFAALEDATDPGAWADLAELLGPGQVALLSGPDLRPPADWVPVGGAEGVQLVDTSLEARADPEALVLGADDVPEMIDLVTRTEPGPFRPRTIALGTYLGIRRGGVLAAMAGERLRPPGWVEISAVCTDPAFRQQGLATRLVRAVARNIREHGDQVFLHTAADNLAAIRLYEAIGFTLRRRTTFAALRTPGGSAAPGRGSVRPSV